MTLKEKKDDFVNSYLLLWKQKQIVLFSIAEVRHLREYGEETKWAKAMLEKECERYDYYKRLLWKKASWLSEEMLIEITSWYIVQWELGFLEALRWKYDEERKYYTYQECLDYWSWATKTGWEKEIK